MGKFPFDVSRIGLQLLTICSQKFHELKKIAALYIRQYSQNVLAIIGFGKVCQLISNKYLLYTRIEQLKRTHVRLCQDLIK
ncbi:unnamed protein product [Rotaria sp. Silwood2]|nr:unnamed protein product [Rotaria sp. Silwood2]CAF3014401.1 unnamed protein product [Rotaria sp. Silwood2]CAF3173269.1 unnamed protein product [Rotaria sp. Silwood2]CAF3288370.1 unnamed protein product [Rotaria sp. Silwood2]CAF4193255.1 unnamed protein product [Rotaria sp. Silwood2]